MDELIELLEKTANMLRGMTFDPQIPTHAKTVMRERAEEIDDCIERCSND